MRAILIEFRSIVVVGDSEQECEGIDSQKKELDRKRKARSGNAKHDTCKESVTTRSQTFWFSNLPTGNIRNQASTSRAMWVYMRPTCSERLQ